MPGQIIPQGELRADPQRLEEFIDTGGKALAGISHHTRRRAGRTYSVTGARACSTRPAAP